MLRGMFEERLQHVIREAKEHRNLILFVDDAHTIVGAGSALGAPCDAAQIFKSVGDSDQSRMPDETASAQWLENVAVDGELGYLNANVKFLYSGNWHVTRP
jgi:ATP-dependent Clp protease ATP-binding subunit ClpC